LNYLLIKGNLYKEYKIKSAKVAVVISLKEKKQKDKVKKGSHKKGSFKLSIPFLFMLTLVAFSVGFFGTVVYFQFPRININKVLLPVSLSAVKEYKTYEITFDDNIPSDLVTQIKASLNEMKLEDTPRFKYTRDSELRFDFSTEAKSDSIFTSYLVPVGHLYWIRSDVKKSEISNLTVLTSKGNGSLVDDMLTKFLGAEVMVNEVDNIAEELKGKDEKKYIGFISVNELNPQLQLLTLDSKYFLDGEMEGGIAYGISMSSGLPSNVMKAVSKNTQYLKSREFAPDSVSKINMTGVTAITRALGGKVDASGDYGYPAKKIADFLKDADLTHTSNEVSFVPGCANAAGMRFCSKPEYIKALQDSGVDIVELTGNHNNDFGVKYSVSTIETYKKLGMDYFGGGLNDKDASKALVKEVKGSKVAFLGYNYYDTMLGTGALAGPDRAGANSFSYDKMKKDIANAKQSADVVIVDFQFQECYSYPPNGGIYPICYKPLAYPDQKEVFRRAVEYGADIVVGAQAHQPQTYEIYKDKIIFYGLGNLFFDQIYWIGTRQGLVLSNYLYQGRVLQTRVSTTLYGNDMQPYVTTGEERELLLNLLKNARD